MPIVTLPDYNELHKSAAKWEVKTPRQDIVPLENLHIKLGVERGARVLFFAGAQGDWAHRLARTTQVHYTDVSREMVKFARRRFAGKGIKRFSTADAMRWPANKQYDYVASFEPIPLYDRLGIIALRALAHSKGMRIVTDPFFEGTHYELGELGKRCESLYGSPSSFQETLIFGRTRHPQRDNEHYEGQLNLNVWRIDSNPKARKKAQLDLHVLAILAKREQISLSDLVRKLRARKVRTTKAELEQSFHRLSELTKSTPVWNTRSVEVTV